MNVLLCDAIRSRRLVRFIYDGYERVIEPHLHGINAANHEAVSGWLVGGWTRTETEPGWRNYLVHDMHDVQVLDDEFAGPRPRFNPRDRNFRQIFCRLELPDDERAGGLTDIPVADALTTTESQSHREA